MGPQGDTGSQGPQGDMGPQGSTGASALFNYVGNFNGNAEYKLGDVVSYEGSTWYAIQPSQYLPPPQFPDVWALFTSVGDTGSQGPQGDMGPQGYQGDMGPQGYQGDMGPQGDQGPQGYQGDMGPQGDQGPQGYQGPQGVTGLQGPTGIQGLTGPTGTTGVTGFTGVTGVTGFTGTTGSVGPTGGARNLFITGVGPNIIGLTSNVALFIANTVLITSSSSTAKYLIMVNMQARNVSGGGDYLLSTLGRTVGNTAPTTSNATNLANNTLFSTSDILISSVNTYMMAGSCYSSGTAVGNSISFVDTPGTGTFTYSVRVLSNSALSLHQFYINVVQLNA